jgi:hypothetical protein
MPAVNTRVLTAAKKTRIRLHPTSLGYLETTGAHGIDNGCESICTNVFNSNTVHLDY